QYQVEKTKNPGGVPSNGAREWPPQEIGEGPIGADSLFRAAPPEVTHHRLPEGGTSLQVGVPKECLLLIKDEVGGGGAQKKYHGDHDEPQKQPARGRSEHGQSVAFAHA